MNIAELLKDHPELTDDLEPDFGCRGTVNFRGSAYKGYFQNLVQVDEGKRWIGILKADDGQRVPFMDNCLPVRFDSSGITFDKETGEFTATIPDRTPSSGDAAYSTNTPSMEYLGIIRMKGDTLSVHGFIEPQDPADDWGFHPIDLTRGLQVGYDGPVEWDAERNMFSAHCDSD